MRAAAEDLDVDLHIDYAQRDRVQMVALLHQAIKKRPDYLLLVNENGVLDQHWPLLERAAIPYFLVNNDLTAALQGRQLRFYLGALCADLADTGYQMVTALLAANHRRPLRLLAIHGDRHSSSSIQRSQGMLQAINQFPGQIELVHQDYGNWSEAQAYRVAFALFKRLAPIDAVWAANDPMAFGAVRAAREAGVDVLNHTRFAGINWDQKPAHVPADYISFGGHMALGSLALVMLDEHFAGLRDLQSQPQITLPISVSNQSAAAKRLMPFMQAGQYSALDFRLLSRRYTAEPLPMRIDSLAATLSLEMQ
ncbi:hypothetical protein GCM10009092_01980 [Bowmanella denitrificans]|uniref:Periplasmic binding protein domain-containing protein n=2 Tax=Bowmanella denitrificans TaxID=366582 RepID=A0ABP3GDI0_9ALTE